MSDPRSPAICRYLDYAERMSARRTDSPGRTWMNRITRLAAITAAALACTASPAFADDDEYTTESVKPSWTAASAESCTDPDVAPLLSTFKDDDLYAPAPG